MVEKIITTSERIIVNTIAEYLERPENWSRLKNCWIVNGESEDLRRLLTEAMEDNNNG